MVRDVTNMEYAHEIMDILLEWGRGQPSAGNDLTMSCIVASWLCHSSVARRNSKFHTGVPVLVCNSSVAILGLHRILACFHMLVDTFPYYGLSESLVNQVV